MNAATFPRLSGLPTATVSLSLHTSYGAAMKFVPYLLTICSCCTAPKQAFPSHLILTSLSQKKEDKFKQEQLHTGNVLQAWRCLRISTSKEEGSVPLDLFWLRCATAAPVLSPTSLPFLCALLMGG